MSDALAYQGGERRLGPNRELRLPGRTRKSHRRGGRLWRARAEERRPGRSWAERARGAGDGTPTGNGRVGGRQPVCFRRTSASSPSTGTRYGLGGGAWGLWSRALPGRHHHRMGGSSMSAPRSTTLSRGPGLRATVGRRSGLLKIGRTSLRPSLVAWLLIRPYL